MKKEIRDPWLVWLAIVAACFAIAVAPAVSEEVFYHFDFEDEVVPDALIPASFRTDAVGDPRYEVSDGHLRIYDTKPAEWSGVLFSPISRSPEQWLTDTHLSAIFNADGGYLEGIGVLVARTTAPPPNNPGGWYECYLVPSSTNASRARLVLNKGSNGKGVANIRTEYFNISGPYRIELDVIDGQTSDGREYTDLTGRLTYNDGQGTRSLSLRDWGTLGGYPRNTAGYPSFGGVTAGALANAGWILGETVDDVTITGTTLYDLLDGDLNGDGSVNSFDLDIIRGNWGNSVEAGCSKCGDPSGDGLVGSSDLDVVRANWGASAAEAIPEPSCLISLLLLCLVVVQPRWRN